jgi:hypothetical protein
VDFIELVVHKVKGSAFLNTVMNFKGFIKLCGIYSTREGLAACQKGLCCKFRRNPSSHMTIGFVPVQLSLQKQRRDMSCALPI